MNKILIFIGFLFVILSMLSLFILFILSLNKKVVDISTLPYNPTISTNTDVETDSNIILNTNGFFNLCLTTNCQDNLTCDGYTFRCLKNENVVCNHSFDCIGDLICSGICTSGPFGNLNNYCPCNEGYECQYQTNYTKLCKSKLNNECNQTSDCIRGLNCFNNQCITLLANGNTCSVNSDCGSLNCSLGYCQEQNKVTGTLGSICGNNPPCNNGLYCLIQNDESFGVCIKSNELFSTCKNDSECNNPFLCLNKDQNECGENESCVCQILPSNSNNNENGCTNYMTSSNSICLNNTNVPCTSNNQCFNGICNPITTDIWLFSNKIVHSSDAVDNLYSYGYVNLNQSFYFISHDDNITFICIDNLCENYPFNDYFIIDLTYTTFTPFYLIDENGYSIKYGIDFLPFNTIDGKININLSDNEELKYISSSINNELLLTSNTSIYYLFYNNNYQSNLIWTKLNITDINPKPFNKPLFYSYSEVNNKTFAYINSSDKLIFYPSSIQLPIQNNNNFKVNNFFFSSNIDIFQTYIVMNVTNENNETNIIIYYQGFQSGYPLQADINTLSMIILVDEIYQPGIITNNLCN